MATRIAQALHLKPKTQTPEEPDPEQAAYGSQAIQNMGNNRSVSEQESADRLGVDHLIANPWELIESLKQIQYEEKIRTLRRLVGEGETVRVVTYDEVVKVPREWVVALIGYLSPVWAAIYSDAHEVGTLKLRLKTAFMDMEEDIPERDLKAYPTIIRMIEIFCGLRCDDMIDGRKAYILKVRQESLKVESTKFTNPKNQ